MTTSMVSISSSASFLSKNSGLHSGQAAGFQRWQGVTAVSALSIELYGPQQSPIAQPPWQAKCKALSALSIELCGPQQSPVAQLPWQAECKALSALSNALWPTAKPHCSAAVAGRMDAASITLCQLAQPKQAGRAHLRHRICMLVHVARSCGPELCCQDAAACLIPSYEELAQPVLKGPRLLCAGALHGRPCFVALQGLPQRSHLRLHMAGSAVSHGKEASCSVAPFCFCMPALAYTQAACAAGVSCSEAVSAARERWEIKVSERGAICV